MTPCNTAHLWFDDPQAALGLSMLHRVEVALDEVIEAIGSPCRIGLLSADLTLAAGLHLSRSTQSDIFRGV